MTESKLTIADLTKDQRRKLQKLSSKDETDATFRVLNIMFTSAVAVRFPAYFWVWHLLRTLWYIPSRYLSFRKIRCELYLLDWCYIVTHMSNLCGILAFLRITFGIHTPLENLNTVLLHAGFAMASGPLAWSVYIFRNSIVFHDMEYNTSVFIHLSPFVLMWCLRWGAGVPSVIESSLPGMYKVCDSDEELAAADECLRSFTGMLWCNACSAPLLNFIVAPAIIYFFIWAVPYFLIVLVRWSEWIEKTNRETLYTYFCQCQPDLNDKVKKLLEPTFGTKYGGPLGYMMLHMTSTLLAGATAYIFWNSFILHTLFGVWIIVKAVQNGSSYTFRIFAYRYAQKQLETHQAVLFKKE